MVTSMSAGRGCVAIVIASRVLARFQETGEIVLHGHG